MIALIINKINNDRKKIFQLITEGNSNFCFPTLYQVYATSLGHTGLLKINVFCAISKGKDVQSFYFSLRQM